MAQIQSSPFVLYDSAIQEFLDGNQDWDDDSHYVVLLTSSYTPVSTHDTFSDLTNEVVDVDYNQQDMLGETVVTASSVTVCDASDVLFGSSVTITAYWVVIVVGTVAGSTGTDKLVGYMELNKSGASVSSTTDTFSIAWSSTNGIFSTRNNSGVLEVFAEVPVISESEAVPSGAEGVGINVVTDQFQTLTAPVSMSGDILTNLIDWGWEADSGLDESDGVAVDTWVPIIGEYDLDQATPADRPIYRATAATNGLPSIEFVGVGTSGGARDFMITPIMGSGDPTDQPTTIIMVVEVITASGTRTYISGTSASNEHKIQIDATPDWTMYAGNTVVMATATTGLKMITCVFNNNATTTDTSRMTIDGTLTTGTDPGSQFFYTLKVGADQASQYGGDFYMHALYVAGRRLSDTEIAQIRTYCQTKWSTT